MANSFNDYTELFERVGEENFVARYRRHALIGIGIVGQLDEKGQRGEAQTFLAAIHGEVQGTGGVLRRVWLLVKSPYGPPTRTVRVGRTAEKNDLVIADYSVSRVHCEFQIVDGYLGLVDLGSHNGTYLNGERLLKGSMGRLRNEDEVVVGRYKFEYLVPDAFVQRIKTSAEAKRRSLAHA